MKIFISWSGQPSKGVALALREWLPLVVQSAKPWMSDQDISAGSVWNKEISNELNSADLGLVCVTQTNTQAAWLNFEAGAISKAIGPDGQTKVVPILIGFEDNGELRGPLTAFNNVMATRDGIWRVLQTINESLAARLSENQLQKSFDIWWPQLEKQVTEAVTATPVEDGEELPVITDSEKIDEILQIIRRLPDVDDRNTNPNYEVLGKLVESELLGGSPVDTYNLVRSLAHTGDRTSPQAQSMRRRLVVAEVDERLQYTNLATSLHWVGPTTLKIRTPPENSEAIKWVFPSIRGFARKQGIEVVLELMTEQPDLFAGDEDDQQRSE